MIPGSADILVGNVDPDVFGVRRFPPLWIIANGTYEQPLYGEIHTLFEPKRCRAPHSKYVPCGGKNLLNLVVEADGGGAGVGIQAFNFSKGFDGRERFL